jgi:hypothetical protein
MGQAKARKLVTFENFRTDLVMLEHQLREATNLPPGFKRGLASTAFAM